MEDAITGMELPKYRSHKTVKAIKITGIEFQQLNDTTRIFCETPEKQSGCILVSAEYREKHNPQIGGYFVEYEDGYQSYSPAKAFEEGYTRI